MVTWLTEDTIEYFLSPSSKSKSIDLREVTFIDPYGMVGLLEIGKLLKGVKKTLYLPESDEVISLIGKPLV